MRGGGEMKKNKYKILFELEDNTNEPSQRIMLTDIYRYIRGIEEQFFVKITSIKKL